MSSTMVAKKCFIFLYALSLASTLICTEVDACCQHKKHELSPSLRPLFVFGDSYADTGNLGKLGQDLTRCWYYPYGVSFPRRPTGRFSDGRVLTDFLASFLGIRSPIPYKYRSIGCKLLPHGMNFAVGGSGVFDTGNLQRNLTTQIDLLDAQIKLRVFSESKVRNSIALVSVAGNDYDHYQEAGGTLENVVGFMHSLIAQLKKDLKRIHELGVPKVLVTNLHPLGCTPYLTRSSNYSSCNFLINAFVGIHNSLLQDAVDDLWNSTSNSTSSDSFVLVDVNSAFMSVISQGTKRFKNGLKPCCEAFSADSNCGEVDEKGVKQYHLCGELHDSFYWDDVHPTQAAWAAVTEFLKPSLSKFLQ